MKKILLSITLICTFIAACNKDNIIIPPQSEEISTANINENLIENARNVPVDAVFYNECCNEEVYFTGLAHFVITSNIIHIKVSNITGTGLSTGFNYISLSPSVETNVFYSNQYEGTFTFMLNMKNQNGCGFKLKAKFHSTMNANGVITAAFENIDTVCN